MPNGISQNKIKTYTLQAIADWQTEIFTLPAAIDDITAKLNATNEKIASIGIELLPFIDQINVIDKDITALTSQINVLTLPERIQANKDRLAHERNELQTLSSKLTNVNAMIAPLENEIKHIQINIDYSNTQQSIEKLRRDFDAQQSRLSSSQMNTHSLESQANSLSSQIRSAQSRLDSLNFSSALDTGMHFAGYGYGYHHHHHHDDYGWGHSLGDGLHMISDASRSMAIADAQSELSRLNYEYSRLSGQASASRSETDRLHHSVSHLRTEINQHQQHLSQLSLQTTITSNTSTDQLNRELQQCYSKKLPHDDTKNQLKDSIHSSKLNERKLESDIDEQERLYAHSLANNTPYSNNHDLIDLNSKRNSQAGRKAKLIADKAPIDLRLRDSENKKQNYTNELDHLKEKLVTHDANIYLKQLTENPQTLYHKLKENVFNQAIDFVNNHQFGQSAFAREILLTLQEKIQLIDDHPSDKKHILLCGMLWNFLRQSKHDPAFATQIERMIGAYSIDEEESIETYRLTLANHPLFQHMTSDQLLEYEKADYQNARRELSTNLSHCSPTASSEIKLFFNTGKHVLDAVNERVSHALKTNEPNFDIKFHTNILRNTCGLLLNPNDPTLIQNHRILTKHNQSGQPSLGKKITGAMLMFSGMALTGVSIGFAVMSLGFGSPLAIAGIATGGAMITSGAALFCHGRKKGIANALDQFKNSTSIATSPHSLWRPQSSVRLYPDLYDAQQHVPSAPPMLA